MTTSIEILKVKQISQSYIREEKKNKIKEEKKYQLDKGEISNHQFCHCKAISSIIP